MNDADNEQQGYVPFDIKDSYYAGAGEVIKQEFELLAEKRENFDKDKLKGVALSGGVFVLPVFAWVLCRCWRERTN